MDERKIYRAALAAWGADVEPQEGGKTSETD
jgi:hypothetical protein